MRLQVWAWRCEVVTCGHTWLAVGVDPPAQCSKCKSRQWHTKAGDGARQRSVSSGGTNDALQVSNPAPSATSELRIGKPDLEALVSGIMERREDSDIQDASAQLSEGKMPWPSERCSECDSCMREVKGKWACVTVGCAMYGREQKR